MMTFKSSQVWLLLSAILALSVYIETTSAEALTCRVTETRVETPLISIFREDCSRSLNECDRRCAGMSRIARDKQCQYIGEGLDKMRCVACCVQPYCFTIPGGSGGTTGALCARTCAAQCRVKADKRLAVLNTACVGSECRCCIDGGSLDGLN